MTIELIGGPFDGQVIVLDDNQKGFSFLVAEGHADKPVYRCTCCPCCAAEAEKVDYQFVGYKERK